MGSGKNYIFCSVFGVNKLDFELKTNETRHKGQTGSEKDTLKRIREVHRLESGIRTNKTKEII
jgi:hypothetical protein